MTWLSLVYMGYIPPLTHTIPQIATDVGCDEDPHRHDNIKLSIEALRDATPLVVYSGKTLSLNAESEVGYGIVLEIYGLFLEIFFWMDVQKKLKLPSDSFPSSQEAIFSVKFDLFLSSQEKQYICVPFRAYKTKRHKICLYQIFLPFRHHIFIQQFLCLIWHLFLIYNHNSTIAFIPCPHRVLKKTLTW